MFQGLAPIRQSNFVASKIRHRPVTPIPAAAGDVMTSGYRDLNGYAGLYRIAFVPPMACLWAIRKHASGAVIRIGLERLEVWAIIKSAPEYDTPLPFCWL